jgi:transcriptional regulator with XRE-family HTH domain
VDEQIAGSPALATTIGQRLRDVRRARGWSQQALAEGLFSKGYVSSIEHGKIFPSVRALQALSTRLGVDMSEFFDPAMLGADGPELADTQSVEARGERMLLLEVQTLAATGRPGVAQRARALIPESLGPDERVALGYALAQAYLTARQPTAALDALEDALQALAATPDTPAQREWAARVQVLIGTALLERGQAALAVEQFARLRQLELTDPALRLAVLSGLARAHAALGDVPQARSIYSEALALAQQSQSLDKLAGQFIALSRRAGAEGRWDEAERLGHSALLLGETYRTFQTVWQTYLDYGTLLRPGYSGQARGLLEGAMQLAEHLGSETALARAGAELALLEIEAGRLAEAELALERTTPAAAGAHDPAVQGRVEYVAGCLAQAHGKLEAAQAGFEAALRLLQDARDPALLGEAAFALARLHVAAGRLAEATPYYEQAFNARSTA